MTGAPVPDYRTGFGGLDLPTLRRMVCAQAHQEGSEAFALRTGCKLDRLERLMKGEQDIPSKAMLRGIGMQLAQVGIPIGFCVERGPTIGGADARKERQDV